MLQQLRQALSLERAVALNTGRPVLKFTCLCLAAVLYASPALAQLPADAPTDLELSAGYCVGVSQQRLMIPNVIHRSQLQANYERMWAYLAARGVWTSKRSLIVSGGVNVALMRGRADGQMCTGFRDKCISQCLDKTQFDQCFVGCFEPTCSKTERCTSDPPKLPF